jgi:hypothetical protein
MTGVGGAHYKETVTSLTYSEDEDEEDRGDSN